MYDTPKAIHFDAYRDGVKLPNWDADGITARWKAAQIAKEMKIEDMSLMTNAELLRMATVCQRSSVGGIVVKRSN